MLRALANTQVQQIDTRAPVVLATATPLGDALVQLRERRRGGCILVDETGRLAGVFTQHDLRVRVDLEKEGWRDTRIADVMTQKPTAIRATQSLSSALQTMNAVPCRSLPVVDEYNRPTGTLSIRDILAHVAENFPQELLNLPPDPTLEATAEWGG